MSEGLLEFGMRSVFRIAWHAAVAVLAIAIGPSQAIAQSSETTEVIVFGQSAAFTGPASRLGLEMKLGLEAAFAEANDKDGGVHGIRIALVSLDDGYEPERTVSNTRQLINEDKVFALVGFVGTPTSRAAVPIALEEGIPYVAPFTGAEFLRDEETVPNVVNMRASYQNEVDAMVDHLIEDRGITKIAVLSQDDSFGQSGFASSVNSLSRYQLEPVVRAEYERNTTAVKTAVLELKRNGPDAVLIIGAYQPAAEAIKWAYEIGFKPVFINISFVGSGPLSRELGEGEYDVFVMQVVPDFNSEKLEVAQDYREAVMRQSRLFPFSYISFEGYLAGRMVLQALHDCKGTMTRECFTNRLRHEEKFDLGGFVLEFGENDNQGSENVYTTAYHPEGTFVPVSNLNEEPGS